MSASLQILCLEESELDGELIWNTLCKGGVNCNLVRVETRTDFEAALERERFDLILADYSLPSFDGPSAFAVAKRRCPKVPFIFITGSRGEEKAVETLKSGATDYVPKEHLPRLVPSVLRALSEAELHAKRAAAEEALRRSAEEYLLLFESNPNPMWVYDRNTLAFLAVNEMAVRHYGYTREEFSRMTIKDIRPAEEVPALIEQASKPGESFTAAGTWRHARKDGSTIDVEVTSHPLTFQGRAAKLVLAHDVTERKRAERALRKSEQEYRDLFENSSDIVYTVDRDGRLMSVNRAAERISGFRRQELLGRNVRDLVTPEYQGLIDQKLNLKLGGARSQTYEVEAIVKNGKKLTLEISNRLIYKHGEIVGIQGTARDISERKLLQEQLAQSQKMEAVGRLAGGVAHDFNNLLTAIIGYCQILLAGIRPDDPIFAHLSEIEKAGKRAASLTSQLLVFSRKQPVQPKELDLNAVVDEMGKLLRRLIGEDIQLLTALEPSLGLVTADAGQIEQIIMNLVINARDAMPKGGVVTIQTGNVNLDESYASHHLEARPGPYVMLAVSDTGVGMDRDTQLRIFEPFFTTKEKGKGTGLGLSTVYGIVKQSGGNIWVYSEPGKGTTFKLYIPRVVRQEVVDTTSTEHNVLPGSETVLVAEDEEAVRKLAKMVLSSAGYTVLEASKGSDAISMAEAGQQIDLLLTDVVMPGTSGKELARTMQKLTPRIRVLYMSGYTDNAIVHHGVIDPGTPFLEKPFTPDALLRKVRQLLDAPATQ